MAKNNNFGGNLICQVAKNDNFGRNLIRRMAKNVNFGGELIWRIFNESTIILQHRNVPTVRFSKYNSLHNRKSWPNT